MNDRLLFVDTYEPADIFDLLKQSVPVSRVALNSMGYADYKWTDLEGNTRQWENKEIGECVADLDAVEEQLNRQLKTCDELTLVVRGVWIPTVSGIMTYRDTTTRSGVHMFTPKVHMPISGKRVGLSARYEGWKRGLRYAGVEVLELPTMELMVEALVAAFRGSLKEEHTTLRRYLREHIPPFDPNLNVDNLCRLKGARIGTTTALKLIDKFGTFYATVTASWGELVGVLGSKGTDSLFQAIGRER